MSDGPTLPESPYKGLARYDDTELDERFFFGRERETSLVSANVVASRLTILYGPSGVGKSSLLRAGVVRRLRSLVAVGPSVAGGTGDGPLAVVVDTWSDDPIGAIVTAAGARPVEPGEELADVLAERVAELGGELYLLLDQMEEYFLYQGRERGDSLGSALAEVLARPELQVHVLIGIRDDALAELDAFKGRLPGLFGNVLRLDHLDAEAARAAFLEPLDALAALGGPRVVAEPALVAAVVDQVASGRIEGRMAGRGIVEGARRRGRVEAAYLQLVLERLWEVERERGSDVLRASTLTELGGAGRIVQEHLQRALAGLDEPERELASRLFNHLVTPSGTKIAHGLDDLGRYAGDDSERIEPVLRALSGERVVRPLPAKNGGGTRYEIFHDVLAGAVLDWRTRHEAERMLAREREAARVRHRRLLAVILAAGAALAVLAALATYAFVQRAEARDRARAAKARELTVASLSELDRDPELAMLLALEAARRERTPAVEAALRKSLRGSRGLGANRLGSSVVAVAPAAGGVLAVTADGRLHRPDGDPRRLAPRFDVAVFDPAGRRLAGAGGRDARVWAVDSGAVQASLRLPAPVVRIAFDGSTLAAADAKGLVRTHRLSDNRRAEFRLPSRATALAVQGDRLVAASGKVVRVFDLEQGRLVSEWPAEAATILGLAIAPTSDAVVTTGADSGIRLRQLPGGTLLNVMLGHLDFVTGAAFVPDGTRFVTIGGDGRARVWETSGGRPFAQLTGHNAELRTVATSRDGLRAVTGDAGGDVRVWDARGDQELRLLRRLTRPAVAVAWEGGRPAPVYKGGTDPRVDRRARIEGAVVHLASGAVLRGHENDVNSVRYSADGARVITASQDRDARIWDARTGAPLVTLSGHFGAVNDASLSPDGRWAVTAGPGTAGVWDVGTGEILDYLRGHEGPLTSAIFAPDSRTVVTAGADGTVRGWRCPYCGALPELVGLAEAKLKAVGRTLTPSERTKNLGG